MGGLDFHEVWRRGRLKTREQLNKFWEVRVRIGVRDLELGLAQPLLQTVQQSIDVRSEIYIQLYSPLLVEKSKSIKKIKQTTKVMTKNQLN